MRRVFWIEFDEEFMVVEPDDGFVKRCGRREARYVAQRCSGCFALLDRDESPGDQPRWYSGLQNMFLKTGWFL